MKNVFSISILSILILVGCQEDTLQEDVIPVDENLNQSELIYAPLVSYQADPDFLYDKNQRRGEAVERPIKFRSEGTITFIPGSELCDGYIQVVIEGSGHGSHMGNISIHLGYCSDGENLLSYVMGSSYASNGDQIFVVLVGAGEDPEKGPFQTYQIYDGTGRFAGASGHYTLYGIIDYENGVWSHEGGGVIVY